jgi:geranylgeranyl pyrophosphate synthase
MTSNDLLKLILNHELVKENPLVEGTIVQKWKYSHYLHGKVALDAGCIAGCSSNDNVDIAVAIEVAWAGVLILDDMVDNDHVRFHGPSAWNIAGFPRASMEMLESVLRATSIIESKELKEQFVTACVDTISAMKMISQIDMSSGLNLTEKLYKKLGRMSAFVVSWPWNSNILRKIAELETCAGQLVNDCNDCFGKKAARRNYPDIRNKQVTLLTSILFDYYKDMRIQDLLLKPLNNDYSEISSKIFNVIRDNPDPLIKVFESWLNEAFRLALQEENLAAQSWTVLRLQQHKGLWENKLMGLLNLKA